MPSSIRFVRIAQDLEKLPCELHDAVLKDLEFEQLVRLSQIAGPCLSWLLENSLSPWGRYLRDGNIPLLCSLLAISGQVRKYCFKPPKSNKTTWLCYERRWPPDALRFLHHRGLDWSKAAEYAKHSDPLYQRQSPVSHNAFAGGESLSKHWLASLNVIVINTSWRAFHADYRRLVEPWIPRVTGATAVFRKIPFVGKLIDQRHLEAKVLDAKRNTLSREELSVFITLYQQLRQVRAESLTTELYRLADIYKAYPTWHKQPFAPQTRRMNEKHIPSGMRIEARKMTKRVAHTWWKDREIYKYRFAFPFPGLIPYNWTLRFFVEVLQKHVVLESPYHKEILDKARIFHERLPTWVLSARSFTTMTEQVDRWAPKHTKYKQPLNVSPMMWEDAYLTHTEEDLVWLQKLGEIVARMEEVFPQVLEDVRGLGWIIGAS